MGGSRRTSSRRWAPVAFARHGLVMGPGGGAFGSDAAAGSLGLGGPLGGGAAVLVVDHPGRQRASAHPSIDRPDLVGPVNVVGPDPRPQRVVAGAIGQALHHPAVLPAPAVALRVVLGEFADDIRLAARRARSRSGSSSFATEHSTLAAAAAWLTR